MKELNSANTNLAHVQCLPVDTTFATLSNAFKHTSTPSSHNPPFFILLANFSFLFYTLICIYCYFADYFNFLLFITFKLLFILIIFQLITWRSYIRSSGYFQIITCLLASLVTYTAQYDHALPWQEETTIPQKIPQQPGLHQQKQT